MSIYGLSVSVPGKILTIVFLAVLVFFSLTPVMGQANAMPDEISQENAAALAVNKLAVDLYRQFAREGENLCFSPYSISSAFAMTYAGARGETGLEMRWALHYGAGIHKANRILASSLRNVPAGSGELRIANSIWIAKGFPLQRSFENTLRTDYSSEIHIQDYLREAERSRGAINDWVAEKTKDRIRDILGQGSIRPDTKMVLVNAIYFKSLWMNQFNESRTEEADFHRSDAETIKARMMNNTGSFQYADSRDAQILKLPYRQGTFSMLVILPKEKNGLKALEEKITFETIKDYRVELENRRVDVFLPKFKTEQTFDLVPALAELGIKGAFSPASANFSGISGKRDLFIDAAVHKAFVEVDEKGAEAAAATVIAMRLSMAYPDKPEDVTVFRADHPFIYIIQDDASGAILFMGKVEKP